MARIPFAILDQLKRGTRGALAVERGQLELVDADQLRNEAIDGLIYTAVFGTEELRTVAVWAI